MIIGAFAVAGFILSLYAWYVEYKAESQSNFKALCDISEKVSCTRAFTSEYGKLLGIKNSLLGMGFYALLLTTELLGYFDYVFYLAIASVLASSVFAYLLYFKLKDYCTVCTSIYIVNILLLIFAYLRI